MYLQQFLGYVERFLSREEGQDFGEYAFIFALVVLIVAVALSGLATALVTEFGNVVTALGA